MTFTNRLLSVFAPPGYTTPIFDFSDMQPLAGLLLQGLVWPLFCLTAFGYSEDLYATQLIGSHFGVPDNPLTYDYVIVGGGTAGLTVAGRLASNPSFTVAVIEAGGFYEFDNGNYSEIPAFASQFTRRFLGRSSFHKLVSYTSCALASDDNPQFLTVLVNRTICGDKEESIDRLVSVYYPAARSKRQNSPVYIRQNVWWRKRSQLSSISAVRGGSPLHLQRVRF